MKNIDWNAPVFGSHTAATAWMEIFSSLLAIARQASSPVLLHNATVTPDRLLSEAAWELWEAFPAVAVKTSASLKEWTRQSSGKAVLILDALSLRELPLLLRVAEARGIKPQEVKVTGSESPSTTSHFAQAIGLQSRSALANDGKPATFALFNGNCFTDVLSMPFEDCAISPSTNIVIWHSWLDDLLHLHKTNPDQIVSLASTALQGEGFWKFINKLRQGRALVITSDHGYAVSKRFSSEIEEPDAIAMLRNTFGASRNKAFTEPWPKKFMPPIVMTHNNQQIIMGQRKWKVQGGFPNLCHGGMSLLEVAVPWIEFSAL
jgi:hypothetical protein